MSRRQPEMNGLGMDRFETDRSPSAEESTGFGVMALVVGCALLVLAGRLTFVQVVSSPGYQDIATGNRVRVIETPAPRGRILDVQGQVLAGSRPSYTVTLDWEALIDLGTSGRRSLFVTAADELTQAGHEVDWEAIEDTFERARRQALEPVVLAEDVSPELWVLLTERDLPGIAVTPRPVRTYPFGTAGGHTIGYLGTVEDQLEADALNRPESQHRYRPGSTIGRGGLERIFERQLRGVPEIRQVEVDSRNRVVRTIEVTQQAEPGNDLHLTINVDLQLEAEAALADQLAATSTDPDTPAPAGSFVALDPSDGAVVALASFPAIDPSEFVFGLSAQASERLLTDPDDPFLNRAVDGLYPAGSTFKPVPAYAALTSGLRGQFEIWEDQGTYRLSGCRVTADTKGCVFQNARGVVMGPLALGEALTRSSDTYFYSIGERFWLERDSYGDEIMQQVATRFGLGSPTGVELPGEASGRVPGPVQRQADHDAFPDAFPQPGWFSGDNVNLAIGQGDLLVTPLQLANMYATLGAEGARFQPRLVNRLTHGLTGATVLDFAPRSVADPDMDGSALTAVVDGLLGVPTEGTGASAFQGFPHDRFTFAAKTGTAEVNGQADIALFAGFGPWPEPRYAFAVVLEEAGFGGVAAAPVARRFLDRVLILDGVLVHDRELPHDGALTQQQVSQ